MEKAEVTSAPCCPVCLSGIELEDEAFLQPCWHRFHLECIKRWIAGFGSDSKRTTCPMCRTLVTALMYDCVDDAFRFSWISPELAAIQPPVGYSMQLTPQQRRRRSVYFRHKQSWQQTQQQQQHQGDQHEQQPQRQSQHQQQHQQAPQQQYQQNQLQQFQVGAAASRMGAPLLSIAQLAASHTQPEAVQISSKGQRSMGRLPCRRLDDPVVKQFLERELQALVLEEDVSLLMAAAWGTLLQCAQPQPPIHRQHTSFQATPQPAAPKNGVLARPALSLPRHPQKHPGPSGFLQHPNVFQRPQQQDQWQQQHQHQHQHQPSQSLQKALPELPLPQNQTTSSAPNQHTHEGHQQGNQSAAISGWCQLAGSLCDVMLPFLGPPARQLSQELQAFMASGLSITAYDNHTFPARGGHTSKSKTSEEGANFDFEGGSRRRGALINDGEDGSSKGRNNSDLDGEMKGRKRQKGEQQGALSEVIEIYDEEEEGRHRESTPIVVSSGSDSE